VIVIPLRRDEANGLVREWHRHHNPVVGSRFSLGAEPLRTLTAVGTAVN